MLPIPSFEQTSAIKSIMYVRFLNNSDLQLYYVAMFLDPIMRSSWIFYCAFPGQKQHSAVTSFFIALGEIFRRFMWNFFRVENEHMTNVGHFMASRDVPLPFALDTAGTTSLEAQPAQPRGSISIRAMGTMKRGMVKMTSKLRVKHAEDFSRRPGLERGPPKGRMPDETELSSDFEMLEDQEGEDENEGIGPMGEGVGGRPMTLHEISQLAHE
jgi:xenotropic and polytropic retrovirus receptor 1